MFKQVMVAVDGSPTSNHGLKAAVGLAADQHAALSIVHVINDVASVSYVGDMGYVPADYIDTMLEDLRKNGRRILAKAEAIARDGGVTATALLAETKGGSIADAILKQVRRARADIIVMGTHGRGGLRRVLMGSAAEAVLREARVPVLLVRSQARTASTPRSEKPRAAKTSPAAAAKRARSAKRRV